ncbi:AI-2E family transporter [Pararhodobacter oceanensis]|uniref:AI-2E family transporter n=1 Tax=Pararhodobacter oceanensis TaxID=2172121 RepID=UPI003A921975
MGVPVRRQIQIWGAIAALLILVLWLLGDVLMPFILGMAAAYFLDPVADRLERMGLSRVWATVTICVMALLGLGLTALLVIPLLVEQTQSLIEIAPQLTERAIGFVTERFPSLIDADSTLRQSLNSFGALLRSRGGELANALLGSAASVINVVLLIVIVPVVAFYMLLDWDRMIARIDTLLPREYAPVIRDLARDIDDTVASFIRGMGGVCLIMGVFYAATLMLVGLQFGLVVGAVAGLVTFIPYVGAVIGGVLAVGLALYQFWGDWVSIGLVAAIFVSGQMLEGNVLTPRLVGRSVGLHPVWLLLALSAFGALFGFVGMLVAVPIAAAIGVVIRRAIDSYKDSALYQGTEPSAAPPPPINLETGHRDERPDQT